MFSYSRKRPRNLYRITLPGLSMVLSGLGALPLKAAEPAPSRPANGGKLAPLKPRRNYIIGHATFADGRPIPNFMVSAESGFAGLGTVKGSNGEYAIRVTDPNVYIVQNIKARAIITYNGQTYLLPLHPVDGLPDAPSSRKFQGDVKKTGVVRNFVLRLSGIAPGYETPPPVSLTTTDTASNRFAFEGCPIKMEFLLNDLPTGSTFQLTLTPNGPLIDGSAGKVIQRTIRDLNTANYYYLYDIPLGLYTASGTLVKPGGSSQPLSIKMWVPLTSVTSGPTSQRSVSVSWPFDSKYELLHSPMLTFSP